MTPIGLRQRQAKFEGEKPLLVVACGGEKLSFRALAMEAEARVES